MQQVLFSAFLLLSMGSLSATPLSDAIERGNKEFAKRILAQGADVNEKLSDGSTALIFAIEKGNKGVIDLLIARGADLKASNANGITPLMMAAQKNDMALSKLLISRRAGLNAKAKDGTTALFYFAGAGNKDMVGLMLYGGADVNVVNETGDSPLRQAAHSGKGVVLQMILSKAGDKRDEKEPMTPLFLAAFRGDVKTARALLDAGAEANAANAFGETAMLWAFKSGSSEMVSTIASYGGDAKAFGGDLYELVKNSRYDLAKQLIMAGADVNRPGDYNYTPLMEVAQRGNVELTQLLLDKGANPNARDVEGFTALMVTARAGQQKTLELLLNAKGINLDEANNHEDTALSLITDKKTPKKIFEMMLNAGASPVVGKPGGKADCISLAAKKKIFDLKAMMEKKSK